MSIDHSLGHGVNSVPWRFVPVACIGCEAIEYVTTDGDITGYLCLDCEFDLAEYEEMRRAE